MIKKFIKIKNIGKFANYSAQGDISLDEVNIIYGENSAGKTTLTSIIRSLLKNEPGLILERKTFGKDENPCVEILCEENGKNKLYKFEVNKWNGNLGNVEIFDEFFINENIYTGLVIESKHQKCLYQFAIGEEGVALATGIEKIKKDLQSNKHPELNSLKQQIQILAKESFKLEQFVDLTEDVEIDKKIEEKKREISTATASNEIREKQILKEIPSLSLPFNLSDLNKLLEKGLTTISEEALQKVTQYISKLANVLQKEAESWLHQGLLCVEYEYIKDNRCPFCQQDLTEAESTIKSYQQYFNEEYRKLKEDIDKYSMQVEGFNIELSLSDIKTKVLNNNALIEFWKKFLPAIEFPELKDLKQYSSQIAEFFKKIKLLLENKSKNILDSIKTDSIDKLSKSVDDLNYEINAYNVKVGILNEKIKELKAKHSEINKLTDELKRLEIQKERFSEKAKDLCGKYQKCKNEIEELKEQIEQKKKDLNTAISHKVKKYGEITNKILEKFGVPFKIIKPVQRYRGKGEEPYFEYFLEIEGYEIAPIQKAKFTLSAGDKNALSLAFFLAKLSLDEKIGYKIVVFDDPVSSLDRNRRRATVEQVRNLLDKVKQVIVFTHYETFAYELYEYLKKVGLNPKTLGIKNRQIEEWDIEEETKISYFKNLEKLEKFLEAEEDISETEARKLIREVLENRLKLGYYKYVKNLGDRCILGPMINELRKIINECNGKRKKIKMFKHDNNDEVIKELSAMEEFSSEEHHGTIDKNIEKVSPEEIKNYVRRTLKLIYEWL